MLQLLNARFMHVNLYISLNVFFLYRLSNIYIKKEGCVPLASAFISNPSHLRELDLSGNIIEDFGVEEISKLLQNSECRLEKLRFLFLLIYVWISTGGALTKPWLTIVTKNSLWLTSSKLIMITFILNSFQ